MPQSFTIKYKSQDGVDKVFGQSGQPTVAAAKAEFVRQMALGFFPLPKNGPLDPDWDSEADVSSIMSAIEVTARDAAAPKPDLLRLAQGA